MIAGEPLADEDSRKVFPSFVWLLRDVLLSLPKGVENLRAYFFETVISACKKSKGLFGDAYHYLPAFFLSLSSPTRAMKETLIAVQCD